MQKDNTALETLQETQHKLYCTHKFVIAKERSHQKVTVIKKKKRVHWTTMMRRISASSVAAQQVLLIQTPHLQAAVGATTEEMLVCKAQLQNTGGVRRTEDAGLDMLALERFQRLESIEAPNLKDVTKNATQCHTT